MRTCTHCGTPSPPGPCPHCNMPRARSRLPISMVALLGLAAFSPACMTSLYGIVTTDVDNDGDGYDSNVDCDDSNAEVHPDQVEITGDGVDSNCDGNDDT